MSSRSQAKIAFSDRTPSNAQQSMTTGPDACSGCLRATRRRVTTLTPLPSSVSSLVSSRCAGQRTTPLAVICATSANGRCRMKKAYTESSARRGCVSKTLDRCACGSRSMPKGRCRRCAMPARRLSADVDAPAKQRDRPERRLDLRPVAEGEPRQRRRAGRVERLDGAMARFLERLPEQFADEADRTEGNRKRSCQRAGPEDSHEKECPHERVHGTRRYENQFREQVDRRRGAEVVRREQADGQGENQREQRAQRCDMNRLHERGVHAARVIGEIDRPHPGE